MNGDFFPHTIYFTQSVVLLSDSDKLSDSQESRYEQLKDAISHKDRATISWLLKEGCPANLPSADRRMDSALHAAVMTGDLEALHMLLAAGAQVAVINPHRQTALHVAFELGDLPMVDAMLRECRDGRDNPFTVYGLSHFHIACVRNDWRTVHAFLERGVNANVHLEKCCYARDYVYYRPLHLAVKHENFEVAEILMKYGANVDAKDRYKRTPLHLACRFNYRRLCEDISSPDVKDWEDVVRVVKAENHQVDIVKLLIRFKADLNALDSNGTPPLFHIFKCDYREIKTAIQNRMREDVDESLWQELLLSLKATQDEKFFALFHANVNVRFTTDARESLLHLIIDGRRLFTVCANSLSPKERDLDDAAKAEAVSLLLRYGADVEARSATGQTALQLAVSSRYPLTARVLVDHSASVAGISFFHYREPGRDAAGRFDLRATEDFLEVLGLLLRRKTELDVGRCNELLMLRQMAREPCVRHLENCDATELRHLLDFGDVAGIDLASFDNERTVIVNREKLRLLLEHVQKLRLAGMPVDGEVIRKVMKYEGLLDVGHEEGGPTFTERCRQEIQELKDNMIDRYASFYDLLFLNVNEIAVRIKNSEFRRSIRDNCNVKFMLYSNLIIKQFVKGLIRSILLESSKEHLVFIIKAELPDPCMENIIGNLKNADLCNLALAFEK